MNLFIVSFLFVLISNAFAFEASFYDNCKNLDATHQVKFFHKVLNETHFQYALSGKVDEHGWLGCGFSQDGSMTNGGLGSDITISFGSGQVFDYSTTEYNRPKKDESQDLTLISFEQKDGIRTFEIVRSFENDDASDLNLESNGKIHVLWALSNKAVDDDENGVLFNRHDARNSLEIDFSSTSECSEEAIEKLIEQNQFKPIGRQINNADKTFFIEWSVDGDGYDAKTITFILRARTEGYVSIGFSQSPSMLNSDIIVGWIDRNGREMLLDMHTKGVHQTPTLDDQQDLTLVSVSEGGGWTTLSFTRPLRSTDEQSGADADLADHDIYVLWAFGHADGTSSDKTFEKHARRGHLKVNLLRGSAESDSRVLGDETSVALPHTAARDTHALLMMLGLPAMLFSGFVIAQPIWSKYDEKIQNSSRISYRVAFHITCQLIGIVLVLIGFGYAIASKTAEQAHFQRSHEIFGFIVVLLTVLVQPVCALIGLFTRHSRVAGILHGLIGRFVLLSSGVVVLLGIALYAPHVSEANLFFGIWFGIMIAVVLIQGVLALSDAPAASPHVELQENDNVDQQSAPKHQSSHTNNGNLAKIASNYLRVAQLCGVFLLILSFVFIALTYVAITSNRPATIPSVFDHCPDCKQVELTMPMYKVPIGYHPADQVSEETTYVCKGFDLGEQDMHAVEFAPIVDNPDVLHHMILWSVPIDMRDRGYFPCLAMPEGALPLWVWAVGVGNHRPPPNVGYPVGGQSKFRYVALQVHYDNPTLSANVNDNSGVQISMTPQKREYDGAFLFIGTTIEDIRLPPRAPRVEISGECFLSNLPYEINVYEAGTHAHKLGRVLWYEHFRNNNRIRWGPTNPHYDFNRQIGELTSFKIQNGDALVQHCVYDTRTASNTVVGGDGTDNEMCLGALYYYPAVDASFCGSLPRIWNESDVHFDPSNEDTMDMPARLYPKDFDPKKASGTFVGKK